MNRSSFDDDFDDLALGDALRRIAGAGPDADAALPGLHRRVRVARMRRISAVAASVAIVAATGTAIGLTAGRGTDRIGPSDTPATLPDDSTVGNGSGSGAGNPSGESGYDNGNGGTGTSGGTPGGTTAPTTPGQSTGSTPSTRPGSGSTPPNSTTTTTIDDDTGGGSDDHGGGSDDSGEEPEGVERGNRPDTSAPTTPTRTARRCTSSAGSFTAVFDGTTSATLIAPAAGYRIHEVEEEVDAAKVVFRIGESEIAVEALWTGSLLVCATSS